VSYLIGYILEDCKHFFINILGKIMLILVELSLRLSVNDLAGLLSLYSSCTGGFLFRKPAILPSSLNLVAKPTFS
jgi:hypothetical protein